MYDEFLSRAGTHGPKCRVGHAAACDAGSSVYRVPNADAISRGACSAYGGLGRGMGLGMDVLLGGRDEQLRNTAMEQNIVVHVFVCGSCGRLEFVNDPRKGFWMSVQAARRVWRAGISSQDRRWEACTSVCGNFGSDPASRSRSWRVWWEYPRGTSARLRRGVGSHCVCRQAPGGCAGRSAGWDDRNGCGGGCE